LDLSILSALDPAELLFGSLGDSESASVQDGKLRTVTTQTRGTGLHRRDGYEYADSTAGLSGAKSRTS
jgi:hypothetical protein